MSERDGGENARSAAAAVSVIGCIPRRPLICSSTARLLASSPRSISVTARPHTPIAAGCGAALSCFFSEKSLPLVLTSLTCVASLLSLSQLVHPSINRHGAGTTEMRASEQCVLYIGVCKQPGERS